MLQMTHYEPRTSRKTKLMLEDLLYFLNWNKAAQCKLTKYNGKNVFQIRGMLNLQLYDG